MPRGPRLDIPGRCAWCGGPVLPGKKTCSSYCRAYRAAWANTPFSEALAAEGIEPRTGDLPESSQRDDD
jgi:hypothetical protein